ncbi:MAG: FAD-binding oxidoreductase [Gammaproteobacteria bacterium]
MTSPEFLSGLTEICGKNHVLHEAADCWPYGYDNSRRHHLPDAVVFPQCHDHVLEIVRFCNQRKIPLIARGRGTGTTGATVPINGGIVMSFEKMAEIIRIEPENRLIITQPGTTNQQIQDAAAQHGFFWPPDPTSASFCSIGGNLAYNSAGPRAVKYGTPRENTLGLRAVTGTGDDIRTGVQTSKGVVGFDLTRLLIGSEGMLAIITEATLKLTPLPETKRTMQALYDDIGSAAQAVAAIMAQPMTPCALEFIDAKAIEMIRDYSNADLPENAGAMLMIEVDGANEAIDSAVSHIRQAAQNSGLLDWTVAENKEQIDALWRTRKALSPALRTVAPKKINEDVVVPVSRIPELIYGLDKLANNFGITIVNFGHAGNGNIHVNLLINPDDKGQLKNAELCLDEVFSLVLALNGTLSGEHGIGLEKRDFVAREIDPTTMNLMKRIKAQFDPNNILNPGKVFPD